MAELKHLSDPEDSETDSEDESFSSLEDIIKKGGRKAATIKKEECYMGKWKHYLKSEGKVKQNLN